MRSGKVRVGTAWRSRLVQARRGLVCRGSAWRSRLGGARPVQAGSGGLGEVWRVRATSGLSGRSWLGMPRRGKLGQGMAVLVNTKMAMLSGKNAGGGEARPSVGKEGGLG